MADCLLPLIYSDGGGNNSDGVSPIGTFRGAALKDLAKGDAVFGFDAYSWGGYKKELNAPDVLPASTVNGVAFSRDGMYLAVALTSSPYLYIYKRNGENFVKLPNPSSLPAGGCNGVAWSPDGTYLAVVHTSSPFITIYKRNGDTFTKLANPSTLPTSTGRGVAWNEEGYLLAVAHDGTPYVTVYEQSGDEFIKKANPSVLPAGSGYSVAWHPYYSILAVGHANSPFLTLYEGQTLTKLNAPDVLPAGVGRGVSWGMQGTYLAVAHTTTPFLSVYYYDFGGDALTRIQNPSTLPPGNGYGVSFDMSGAYLAICCSTRPYLAIYQLQDNTLTRLPDTSTPFNNYCYGVAFTHEWSEINLLAVVSMSAPYIKLYKTLEGKYIDKISVDNIIPFLHFPEVELEIAVADAAVTAGETVDIGVLARAGGVTTSIGIIDPLQGL